MFGFMTCTRVIRLAAILASTATLGSCGVPLSNDGHMFQRLADDVRAIPLQDQRSDGAAAAGDSQVHSDTAAPSTSAIVVKVVDALDMPAAQEAGLRAMLGAVTQLRQSEPATVSAGLRSLIGPGTTGEVAAASDSAGHYVRLGAFRQESGARAAWIRLKSINPAVFSGANSRVQRVDLGAKGIWYRLSAGPFEGAARVCQDAHSPLNWCAGADRPRA